MGELTTATPGGSTPAAAPTAASVVQDPATTRSDAPSVSRSFSATGTGGRHDLEVRDPWGSSSPVTTCRRLSSSTDLARFGVVILDFKPPAQEGSVTWEQRFGRLFRRLQADECS